MDAVDYTVSSGQRGILLRERGVTLANCKLPLLVIHGHGGSAYDGVPGGYMDQAGLLRDLARMGYAVLSVDAGGAAGWGNTASVAAVAAAQATIGRQVGVVPYSMGGLIGLGYALDHPADVRGVFALEPVTSLAWAKTDPFAAGWAAEITAAGATRDPLVIASSFRGLPFPIKIAHSTNDEVVPYSQTPAFIAAVNDPKVTLRTPAYTGGHTTFFPQITAAEVAAFFDAA